MARSFFPLNRLSSSKVKIGGRMQEGIQTEAPLNPGLVFEMMQAYQRTAALKAAIELDVFRAVGEGPGDVASIARQCSSSERGIRILCDFLVINGVLAKD